MLILSEKTNINKQSQLTAIQHAVDNTSYRME